jgi:tetratricopeptide (TPR) repeat protein
MKTTFTLLLTLAIATACSLHHDCFARGGGGGGGRGGFSGGGFSGGGGRSFSGGGGNFGGGGASFNRGGGNFGGGADFNRGGGNFGGGANVNRTPSFNTPRDYNFGGGNFNRPSTLPATNRPSLPNNGAVTRPTYPNFNDRPGGGGGGIAKPNYPNFNDRPGGGNNAINRPGNIGNNTNINRPNIGNNTNINRPINVNNINNVHAGIANRPIDPHYGVRPNYGNWYHGDWHCNWNHAGWYHRPAAWWGAGFIAGAAVGYAPWNWGYWPYYNPYCGAPLVVDGTTIDYSEPIVLAQSPTTANYSVDSADASQLTPQDQAMQIFDTARQAFYDQDYPSALKADEQALALLPTDAVLNEFRGATLFATGKYKDAAGVIYAVLSVGPGWDWTTLSALYANVETYTEQLRALEGYVRLNSSDPSAHFLLAYEYLTCGSTDAAAKQLQEVVSLNPQDSLSAQLLKGLTDKEPEAPADQAAPAEKTPAAPVTAASLVGNWNASRADGSTFALSLTADGKYTWKYAQKGQKPQQFNGPFSVADNLLILKQNDTPVMVGQVTSLGQNQFNFKLPGENPSDPGLTFSK